MKTLHWARSALRDMRTASQFIARTDRPATDRVLDTIEKACHLLRDYPDLGRMGRIEGTREMVIPGLPYLVIYTCNDTTIHITRILHGAQDWPPA
jgi:toxin ParE1/3/4